MLVVVVFALDALQLIEAPLARVNSECKNTHVRWSVAMPNRGNYTLDTARVTAPYYPQVYDWLCV